MPLYARSGVRFLWLVDPAAKSVDVFHLESKRCLLFSVYAEGDKNGSRAFSRDSNRPQQSLAGLNSYLFPISAPAAVSPPLLFSTAEPRKAASPCATESEHTQTPSGKTTSRSTHHPAPDPSSEAYSSAQCYQKWERPIQSSGPPR